MKMWATILLVPGAAAGSSLRGLIISHSWNGRQLQVITKQGTSTFSGGSGAKAGKVGGKAREKVAMSDIPTMRPTSMPTTAAITRSPVAPGIPTSPVAPGLAPGVGGIAVSPEPTTPPTPPPTDITTLPPTAPFSFPTPAPSPSPSESPTESPVNTRPSAMPSSRPTNPFPTPAPSPSPSASPSESTPGPTASPTASPTMNPSTAAPVTTPPTTLAPTMKPTGPTAKPTDSPAPSPSPSGAPSDRLPSTTPTDSPQPTPSPSFSPTISRSPTPKPTFGTPTTSPVPTGPSNEPTESPEPSPTPSETPTAPLPSVAPTDSPAPTPTPSGITPTRFPTVSPGPSSTPSDSPAPSPSPSFTPSTQQSFVPSRSLVPSGKPTDSPNPTPTPSDAPSKTLGPTTSSNAPSRSPSFSSEPSLSGEPSVTLFPSASPSFSNEPSITSFPSATPSLSERPSITDMPSSEPSDEPTCPPLPNKSNIPPRPLLYVNSFENELDICTPTCPPASTSTNELIEFGGTIARTQSGNGIDATTGVWYVDTDGAFSRLGGYSSIFPDGGYVTSVDIYLDISKSPNGADLRFDWTSAVNNQAGSHRRDFIFSVGTDGSGGFIMSVSNNSPGWPGNPARDPFTISQTGWYTFEHFFYDMNGVLAVDLSVLNTATGNNLKTWTLSDASDTIQGVVGGNRYSWLISNAFTFTEPIKMDTLLRTAGKNSPITEANCKYGGWTSIVRSDGSSFSNRCDCIQYIITGI